MAVAQIVVNSSLTVLPLWEEDSDPHRNYVKWRKYEKRALEEIGYVQLAEARKVNAIRVAGGELLCSVADASTLQREHDETDIAFFLRKVTSAYREGADEDTFRVKFFNMKQHAHEDVPEFRRRLIESAEYCGFGDEEKARALKLTLWNGLYDEAFRMKAKTEKWSVVQVVQKWLARESAKSTEGKIDSDFSSAAVNRVHRPHRGGYQQRHQGGQRGHSGGHGYHGNRGGQKNLRPNTECFKCGCIHAPDSCPAKDRKCNSCGKTGHYAQFCFQKKHNGSNNSSNSHSNSNSNRKNYRGKGKRHSGYSRNLYRDDDQSDSLY